MFNHEKLDVYRTSLSFIAWAYRLSKTLEGVDRHARDQLIRASQSILLNIAEGNGKRSGPDRRRFLGIARGSGLECAAVLDILVACEVVPLEVVEEGKGLLLRIIAMLSKMTENVEEAREDGATYGKADHDHDHDHDDIGVICDEEHESWPAP